MRNKFLHFFWIITLLTTTTTTTPASAVAQEESKSPGFGLWAGAGTGLLTASETSVPFRLNLGAEYYFESTPHFAIGYMAALPFGFDRIDSSNGTGTPFRMAHYFPHLRCFVIPDRLSIQGAVGIAMQHTGSMMSSGNGGFEPSFAAHLAGEFHIELEPAAALGLEAGYDFFSRSTGSQNLPRVLSWTLSANFHFRIGGE